MLLKIDGVEVEYYTSDALERLELSDISIGTSIDPHYWDIPIHIRKVILDDLHIGVVELLHWKKFRSAQQDLDVSALQFYYWWPQPKPENLDKRVAANEILSTDFQDTMLHQYVNVNCWNCNRWWHSLVLQSGSAFLSDPPSIYEAKFQRRINSRTRSVCPHCGVKLRLLVYRIFGEA